MAHNNHTEDSSILELANHDRQWYVDVAADWIDPLGDPIIVPETLDDGRIIHVIREDLHETGLKARWADLMVSQLESDTIVYVQPRVGYAGISLARVAKKYGKKVILFCPAAKEASIHQRIAAELGAELRFVRIAAMPVLNMYAKAYADKWNLAFVPLGLKHPLVTAAGVNFALRISKLICQPREMWFATSTGVLARAFMVAYGSECDYRMVAVARNMKAGEKGLAKIYSHPREFSQPSLVPTPFPSIRTYDQKCWEYVVKYGINGAFVMNVAAEQPEPKTHVTGTDKAWYDLSALELPPTETAHAQTGKVSL